MSEAILLRILLLALAGFGILASGSRAQDPAASVDSTRSTIAYTGQAVAHDWTGTSRTVTGRLVVDPADPSRSTVEITAPVASFDSGNRRRDAKMRKTMAADRYPTVHFRADSVAADAWGRTNDGHAGIWTVHGRLTVRGQTQPVVVPVAVQIRGNVVTAQAQFDISLTAFDVDRPKLLFVPIGDTITIEADIYAVFDETPTSET